MTLSQERRVALYEYGVQRATLFCQLNRLPVPKFRNAPLRSTGLYEGKKNRVTVNVPVTALPIEKPRLMLWSYPGFKTDRTAVGVPCHEVGHHTEYTLARQRVWSHRNWSQIAKDTPRITSYEPNVHEAFAETMRLFILNPDLLKHINPRRYAYITRELRLEPIEDRSAYEVVDNKNYHARIKQLIETGK